MKFGAGVGFILFYLLLLLYFGQLSFGVLSRFFFLEARHVFILLVSVCMSDGEYKKKQKQIKQGGRGTADRNGMRSIRIHVLVCAL